MIRFRYASLLLLTLGLSACGTSDDTSTKTPAAPVAAVAAPDGTKWSDHVVATDEGGVRMGNPNAPIQIIEYGSYTCPHCRDFQAEAHEAIEKDYVDSGKLSFEYRSMIRDPWDLTTVLVAHCAPPEAFFAMNTALFANQENMVKQIQSHSQAELEATANVPPEKRFERMGELANLIEFAKQRGMPEATVRACLADTAKAQALSDAAQKVLDKYPDFPGTPSFILNGDLLDSTASWSALQVHLRDAGA